MKYLIQKDSILNCWVVWELYLNCKVDVFHGKTKKECKKWLEYQEV